MKLNVDLMIKDCLTCKHLYSPQSISFLQSQRGSKWALSKKQEDWLKELHNKYIQHIESKKRAVTNHRDYETSQIMSTL